MTRITTLSTFLGLAGLVVAMLSALSGGAAPLIAFGFIMMALGFAGAVIGAAITVGRAWEVAR
ncbi:hypothetical protein [Ruegeria lacuscaerulensis]|uniref:hypothetical protein n=1 Tax=Ruegeria lacuscaerulensis TaxID=55218 RepID=UPI00147E51DC|nr:hypothetical protein [Ruegeria lacuscaerulensis]